MNALSKREKIMIAAALGVAIMIGVPGLVLFPASTGAGSPTADAQRKHDQIMAELLRTRTEMNALQGEIDRHVSPGDARSLVERMLGESQAAARAAELALTDLKPAQPENVAGLRRVPVEITLSAPFPRVVRFLYELERRDRRVRVDGVRMITSGGKAEGLDLELRLVGYVKEGVGTHVTGS